MTVKKWNGSPLLIWALILGLWALLVVAFAGQLMFAAGLPWQEAFRLSLRDWLPWALLGPAVAWTANKFPLEKRELALSIPVHVAACMLVVLACELISRPQPGQPPLAVQGQLRRRLNAPENPRPFTPNPDLPPFDRPRDLPRDLPPPLAEARQMAFINGLVMRAKFNIPIYWIIVSIVHAASYHRRSEERERKALALEARLAETRLQALRMQLHPHFLFNTLNAISTLVHRDAKAADEMIANLSELLRTTLETQEQEIPLRQELQLLDRYLEIQQVRFGERLRVEKQIEPGTLNLRVPTFVLQPVVENALRHGIEPQPGPGFLRIQAWRTADVLRLAVHDNGPGVNVLPKGREGVGLANTKARLEGLHGSRGRLTLSRGPQGGCTVEIELPCVESGQEPDEQTHENKDAVDR